MPAPPASQPIYTKSVGGVYYYGSTLHFTLLPDPTQGKFVAQDCITIGYIHFSRCCASCKPFAAADSCAAPRCNSTWPQGIDSRRRTAPCRQSKPRARRGTLEHSRRSTPLYPRADTCDNATSPVPRCIFALSSARCNAAILSRLPVEPRPPSSPAAAPLSPRDFFRSKRPPPEIFGCQPRAYSNWRHSRAGPNRSTWDGRSLLASTPHPR